MKAVVIAVGNELIFGQTVDTNSAWLADQLARRGLETVRHVAVGDSTEAIAEAIRHAAARADVVLVSGGLGPTADDLTRQGLAQALGVELQLNEACLAELEAWFSGHGRQMIPANRIQAMFPAGAEPLPNRYGTAPGIAASIGGAQVFVMPGVPHEMRGMYHGVIAPRLGSGDQVILHHVVHTFGTGESDISHRIGDLMADRSGPVMLGTTVQAGMVSIRITVQAAETEQARRAASETAAALRSRLGALVVGEGDETMPSVVGRLLGRAGQTLATAESCTGGLVGQMITAVPGASDYYLGGVISYANQAKRRDLGVADELLAAAGAVSEPVARAMAEGCRERFASDWAVALTGIAGPAGGSDDKPVGLVYIALAGPHGSRVHRHVFPGDRRIIRLRAALSALNYVRLALLD